MAGATKTTIQDLLKDVYLPPVVEQLNNEVLLASRLRRVKDADMVGNQVVVPLHIGRSGAIGARGELEALPAAGNQIYDRATFTLTQQYGRFQVSGVSRALSKSNVGSFLEVLKGEIDGLRNDLRKDIARQVWGPSDGNSGGNGRIAQCGTTTASTTVVLADDEPLRKGHLYVGMVVDIGTAADPDSLTASGATISAVNIATPSITIDVSVTTSSSHFVSRFDAAGKELTSLQDMVSLSANTVGGIDASSNSYWDNLRDNVAGALVQDDMQQMWNRIRVAGGDVSLILTTFGLQRAYYNLLQDQVRYVEQMEFKSGYSALAFNNKPLVADVDARFGQIYFLDEKHFLFLDNEDWHFLDEDGDILKWVTGYDAWEGALAAYFQLGINRRNVQGVMYGLTDDPQGI